MDTRTEPVSARKLWRRALGLTLSIALALTIALMMWNATQLPSSEGEAVTRLFGLEMFTSVRDKLPEGGSSVQLRPSPNLVWIWLTAIAVAGVLVWLRRRRDVQLDRA